MHTCIMRVIYALLALFEGGFWKGEIENGKDLENNFAWKKLNISNIYSNLLYIFIHEYDLIIINYLVMYENKLHM